MLASCIVLVSYLSYSTPKTEATSSFEMSVDFEQTIRLWVPEGNFFINNAVSTSKTTSLIFSDHLCVCSVFHCNAPLYCSPF